jgi:hypothetical protein
MTCCGRSHRLSKKFIKIIVIVQDRLKKLDKDKRIYFTVTSLGKRTAMSGMERVVHTSLSSLDLALLALSQTHTSPATSTPLTSTSFKLDEPYSTNNTVVQNESLGSCASSLRISPPSEELEQDSKEGLEGEEHLDPGGVGGRTGG